jgi:hypothetical protein
MVMTDELEPLLLFCCGTGTGICPPTWKLACSPLITVRFGSASVRMSWFGAGS